MSSPGYEPTEPEFTDVWLPRDPSAIVLVLHGGAQQTTQPVDGRSLSWRRARPLARHLARTVGAHGLGVVLLRYRVKGWNAEAARKLGLEPDPVRDARWALEQLADSHGVPVVVVGHSMGARTAVAVADDPSVLGVVGLAPWFAPEDAVTTLRGKILRAAHGWRDRITSAQQTAAFVARAAEVGDATMTGMGPAGHYLFTRVAAWHRFMVASVEEIVALNPMVEGD